MSLSPELVAWMSILGIVTTIMTVGFLVINEYVKHQQKRMREDLRDKLIMTAIVAAAGIYAAKSLK